jgi:hypothetical protein
MRGAPLPISSGTELHPHNIAAKRAYKTILFIFFAAILSILPQNAFLKKKKSRSPQKVFLFLGNGKNIFFQKEQKMPSTMPSE